MAYYGGGNYAAGDNYGRAGNYPYAAGGIFSGIGKLLKGAARAVVGSIPIIGGGLQREFLPSPSIVSPFQIPSFPPVGAEVPRGAPGAYPVPGMGLERILPGGQTGFAQGFICGPGGAPRGHLNKSTYVTRGGGTSRWPQELVVHPKGTECVGPRRMNVANPRALRRALRRAQGFSKLAARYVKVQRRFKTTKRRRR